MLTILHTNDFHNQLTATQAQRLHQERLSVGETGLLLDAGDAIGAGNITFRPGGEPILETMTQIGYDAMTVGNREFHFSRMGFHSKLSRASFPILCANVRRSGKELPSKERSSAENEHPDGPFVETSPLDPPVVPYIQRVLSSGWHVVILGVTVPMITERMLVRKASAYVFEDPILTAQRLIPSLREQYHPDLLIALTHIGVQQDRLLATQVTGIDLIIGGHTHVVLPEGERVGETLIVQAGCKGHYMGRVHATKTGNQLCLTASLETL